MTTPPFFSKARAVFLYDDSTAPLVRAFKYGGVAAVSSTFSLLAQGVEPLYDLAAPECIIPVPLHPKRLRQRGFNQAVSIARLLFAQEKKLIEPEVLVRRRWTEPQVGLRGRERRRNLTGAFLVRKPGKIQGRRITIVDDVFTTGTTVNECARELIDSGAGEVQVLTLALVAG